MNAVTIRIVCVGQLKETFWKEAVEEYRKRLSRWVRIEISETDDEKTPERFSPVDAERILNKEGERVLKLIPKSSFIIALDLHGEKQDSEGFADKLQQMMLKGKSILCIIIGGSLGLSKELLSHADMRLSFSDMTFSHQIMRPILMEQIYRAFKIIHGEPYHK
jgi:23S rRNA (pseudouridine1915-N3)-methyltransferase